MEMASLGLEAIPLRMEIVLFRKASRRVVFSCLVTPFKSMGWSKKSNKHKMESNNGMKIGTWNKGGALQPLREKLNEIEVLIKSNDFSVFGISEKICFSMMI